MATKYWFGGTGTWDNTNDANWSLNSGNSPASPTTHPVAGDNVIIDGNSGTGTITRSGAITIGSLNCTGYTGTLAAVAASTTIDTGDVTLASGMTFSVTSANWTFTTSGTSNITTAGKQMPDLTVNGTGTVKLLDNYTCATNRDVTLTKGTLNLNGFILTTDVFASSNSNTRTLAFGAGELHFATLSCSTTTNMSVTGTSTGSLHPNATSTITSGSGLSWPAIIIDSAALNLTINSTSSFDKFININDTAGCTVILSSDVTFTNGFYVNSSTSNSIISILKSNSAGVARTLTASNAAPVIRQWCVQDITAAGTTPFRVTHLSSGAGDLGNNTNIVWDGVPQSPSMSGVG